MELGMGSHVLIYNIDFTFRELSNKLLRNLSWIWRMHVFYFMQYWCLLDNQPHVVCIT